VIRSVSGWARSLVVLVPFVLACSSSTPKDPGVPSNDGSGDSAGDGSGSGSEGSGEEGTSSKPHKRPASSSSSDSSGSSGDGASGLSSDKKEWMEAVLKRGAGKAANCTGTVPDGKGGEGDVKILFDGKIGKITEVSVGAPWAGTSMEACIKRGWVGEYIMPFEGDPLEVPYSIKIPEKAGAAAAADPKKPGKKK